MSPPMPNITARENRRRAVITGIGPITCIGTGVDRFWDGILTEKSGIGGITSFDPSVFHVHGSSWMDACI